MSITPGWHTIPLRAASPAPRSLSGVSGDDESVECVIKHRSSVSCRGEVRAFRTGQRTTLPLQLAAGMIAAGTAEPIDRSAPWTRMLDPEGHEVRVNRGGVITAS